MAASSGSPTYRRSLNVCFITIKEEGDALSEEVVNDGQQSVYT
jgi:hypothetical protein